MATSPAADSEPEAQGSLLFPERRRPGRMEFENPHLIGLLRARVGDTEPVTLAVRPEGDTPGAEALIVIVAEHAEADSLAAARGIALGSLIGTAMWAAIVALGWWLVTL